MLLENALRRARVGVRVIGHLLRREPLSDRTGSDWRDGCTRTEPWRLERQRGSRRGLRSRNAQGQLGFGGSTGSGIHYDDECRKIEEHSNRLDKTGIKRGK